MRGNSPNRSVRRSDFSKLSLGEAISTVQRVRKLMASIGLNGAPRTSGKKGDMLFFATGVAKYTRVPALNAFMTSLANTAGALNQRWARGPPGRGPHPSTARREGAERT